MSDDTSPADDAAKWDRLCVEHPDLVVLCARTSIFEIKKGIEWKYRHYTKSITQLGAWAGPETTHHPTVDVTARVRFASIIGRVSQECGIDGGRWPTEPEFIELHDHTVMECFEWVCQNVYELMARHRQAGADIKKQITKLERTSKERARERERKRNQEVEQEFQAHWDRCVGGRGE